MCVFCVNVRVLCVCLSLPGKIIKQWSKCCQRHNIVKRIRIKELFNNIPTYTSTSKAGGGRAFLKI